MAVRGLDKFKEYFGDFQENYVIIGGTACSIMLRHADMKPRATKDIDMILVVERMTPEFGRRFWSFIHDGDYEQREKKRGEGKEPKPELFRFYRPRNEEFPYQIELLSKQPEDTIGLICLKMKAYLNLSEQEPPAHGSDVRKHMSDVFKLMASTYIAEPIELSETMKSDAAAFVTKMESLMPNQPLQASIQRDAAFIEQVLLEMRRIFALS